MKKLLLLKFLFTTVIILTGTAYGQIVAWDFTSEANMANSTAEVYNSHLDAGNILTRGAGASSSTGSNSFRTTGFSNDGISTSNTDYFETTISAATGYTLSLSTIDANLRGTNTFAASPGVTHQFAYSLDGSTFTLVGSSAVVIGDGSGNATLAQVSLTGISALQNVTAGTTITLRYYASGQTTSGGWGFYSASSGMYGLAVGGSVDPVVVCNAPAPLATGATVNYNDGAHLTVTASQGGTMSWYDAPSGGTLLRHGLFYNTPELTTTTTFWVDETVSGCPASPRTAVVATVLPAINNLRVHGMLEVDSTARFQDSTYFYGNTRSLGTSRFENDATFSGKVIMDSIPYLNNAPSSISVLLSVDDGEVQKIDGLDFLDYISTAFYSFGCLTDTAGNVLAPTWSNDTNKLYTPCPEVLVGVGTSDPIYKLDVRGDGYFQQGIRIGTLISSNEIENDLANIDVETPSNSKPFIRFSHKTGSDAPETRFRVDNNGEVYCTSVKVRLAANIPVPDYVFRPDYTLMPLDELQNYISKNSHLPNIPSEAEIKANGMNLEEMQLKLLEKTEELTLYILQLEKRNQEQDALIKELQDQISKGQK